MLEFSDTGEIGLLIDAGSAALREATIGKGSILSGKEPAFAFGTLRANDLIWRYATPGLAWGYFPKQLGWRFLTMRRHAIIAGGCRLLFELSRLICLDEP